MDQTQAPYLDAVIEYVRRDPSRLHVPGHKGIASDPELIEAIGMAALEHDISAGLKGIDLGPAPTPFQQSQDLAADAWGAARSWFLLHGGSQGNHVGCLALGHLGKEVIVQRNVHSSTVDGMIMAGLIPTFVQPEIDPELGIAHCITPENLEKALSANPDAVGVMIVSPTYFGAIADISALAEVAHAAGVPLLVDEAWGAHLYFSSRLPEGALACGADLVLSSTHKIVGSLGQSAILHRGHDSLIGDDLIDRCLTILETTSPSSLLSVSLDGARRFAALEGERLLGEVLDAVDDARARIRAIPELDVLDERLLEAPSVHGWDGVRLAVDVRGTGASGHRVADLMRELSDVNVELYTENIVEAMFGMGSDAERDADRLVSSLEAALGGLDEADRERRRRFASPPPWGTLRMTPREAFLGPQESVSFAKAEGRIAAESLAAYPPGVPNVLPGEELTRETIQYVTDTLSAGGQVRGAGDQTLETVRVVANP